MIKGGKDDFFSKVIHVPINCKVELIREFSNQLFTKNTSMKADCAILLVDLTQEYEAIQAEIQRFNQIVEERCDDDIVRIIVGTKVDMHAERKAPHIRVIKNDAPKDFKIARFEEIDATQAKDCQDIIELCMNEIKRKVVSSIDV